MAIPWEDLQAAAEEGMRIGMLLVNHDLDGGELTYFSQMGGPPWNVPTDWGELLLVGADYSGEADAGGPDAGGSDAGGPSEDGGQALDADSGQEAGCACSTGRSPQTVLWPVYLFVVLAAARLVSRRQVEVG